MAKQNVAKQTLRYFLGTCLPCSKENAVKIKVKKLDLDEHILMYFSKFETYYAADPKKLCKVGDIVLIQNLPMKLTRLITHKVVDVIYPMGDITDPVTGKKVTAERYRDEIEETSMLYGKSKDAFDYDKAPPRGRLEDKLDFSHKESYIKYYDDPDNPQPYAI